MISKKELRKEILARRDALSVEERKQKSEQIAQRVIGQRVFQNADKLLLFSSFKSEVDTTEIHDIAKGFSKDIYYPRVIGNEMEFYLVDETTDYEISKFGIREPKINNAKRLVPQKKDKVLVVVPGAVFDEDGNRIGYGGGYYDKYLQQLETQLPKENICKIAVAFECQMVDKGCIKSEMHDICPNYIVTENRIIRL